ISIITYCCAIYPRPTAPTLSAYTTLFRSEVPAVADVGVVPVGRRERVFPVLAVLLVELVELEHAREVHVAGAGDGAVVDAAVGGRVLAAALDPVQQLGRAERPGVAVLVGVVGVVEVVAGLLQLGAGLEGDPCRADLAVERQVDAAAGKQDIGGLRVPQPQGGGTGNVVARWQAPVAAAELVHLPALFEQAVAAVDAGV